MFDDSDRPAGARVIPAFLTAERADELLRHIDNESWMTDLRRRVQHYGWRYDYKARSVSSDSWLGPLPGWLSDECVRLTGTDWFEKRPDQVIVNEYLPGQGIAAHVDCVPCFGPVIASLTLGSACEMIFANRASGERRSCMLHPNSLIVLSGPARFEWTHAIPARKTDSIGGQRVPRRRRVSLTYRTVNTPGDWRGQRRG